MTLLPDAQSLIAFLVASLVLAVTPGAGVAYIVTRSVTHGRRSGMASVCGVAAGNWCNAIGASIGLAAVFAMSSAAFTIVKLAGAAYLVYLGMQILRGPSTEDGVTPIEPVPVAMVFRDGFIVALLNPKTALFFAAFLPQFMTAGSHAIFQPIVLGTLFVGIAAITDTMYALTASSASVLLSRSSIIRRGGKYLSGGIIVGLGIVAALSGDREPGSK